MQIDLVPGLPPSGGYENIVTAMDVLSRYSFAYPTTNRDAKAVTKVIIDIMTKHAYLTATFISDKVTAFVSNVIKVVAGVLGITLKHATTKHAQRIGLLERSHASIKQALKIERGERRSLWHKYVSIAVLNHNTSSHTSICCEPSSVSCTHSFQYPRFKNGYWFTEKSASRLADCPRCARTDGNDFPGRPQKSHASLYQIQSVI